MPLPKLDPVRAASIRALRAKGYRVRDICTITGLSEYSVAYGAPARSFEERHQWDLARKARYGRNHYTPAEKRPTERHTAHGTVRGCPTTVTADTLAEAAALLAGMRA